MGAAPLSVRVMDPSNKIIQLAVGGGNEPTIINVHEDVLCRTSKFFKSSLKPEWTSMKDDPDTVDMCEDDPAMVKLYVSWLYSAQVPIDLYHPGNEGSREIIAREAEKVYLALIEAYTFGAKVLDIAFQNAIVERFVAAQNAADWHPGPESVNLVFSRFSASSPLFRLITDAIAYSAHDDSGLIVGWSTHIEGYDKEVLVAAMKAMMKIRPTPSHKRPYTMDPSSYFEKEEAEA